MALIDDVKVACRVTSNAYDAEFNGLIAAACADLGITDIKSSLIETPENPLILRAIITYCKMNFGYLDVGQYERLKKSYDEQKSQMLMATNYTEWGGIDA